MKDNDRIDKIVSFLREAEKLKLVERIPYLSDRQRRENDAEHSWHLALIIMALEKELGITFDALRTLKIAIVHDLVEIYTGDDWVPDKEKRKIKKAKELQSANRLFSSLPKDLEKDFKSLWLEYAEGKSIEAKIAKALDKISYSLQYTISKKVEYERKATREESYSYAMPFVSFSPVLTQILDDLLEESYRTYGTEGGEL